MPKRLRTRVSQAYWCDPADTTFTKALIPSIMRGNPQYGTCWLDELFEGGILVPDEGPDGPQALTMVLSGPPGTGKTTFATELCCRLAESPKLNEQTSDEIPRPLNALYVTSEANKHWIIQNALSFQWPDATQNFGESPNHRVRVATIEDIDAEFGGTLPAQESSEDKIWHVLLRLLAHHRTASDARRHPSTVAGKRRWDIVVIDSLNTIDQPKLDSYRYFMQLATKGPKLIVAIADSAPVGSTAQDWEFAADIVLRLDSRSFSGYLLRTIEIVKARYQAHVWGKHQLKIYEPSQLPPLTSRMPDQDANALRTRRMRAHPYRAEGGIFAFPSIHYVLPRYKALSPSESAGDLPSPVPYLEELLGSGFPKGRCVALIGGRGTHKSHLGYLQVLDGIVREYKNKNNPAHERAIVVSLRDGEDMTRETLKSILVECFQEPPELLRDFEQKGRLEITYFPPGFITPEEFFHRMMLSIHRMKQGSTDPHVTVLFNSLDQLSSRFALCAKQSIFIPGIIQMLSAERVTSFLVAAHDRHTHPDYYGLDSMAELIVRLNRRVYKRDVYLQYMQQAFPSQIPSAEYDEAIASWPDMVGAVELKIERFAGGQPAGAAGILELVKEGPLRKLFPIEGLILAPYAQEHVDKRRAKFKLASAGNGA